MFLRDCVCSQLEAKEKESAEIQRNFRMVDKNANEEVDVHEFGTLLRHLGIDFDEAEVQKQFQSIDVNGDGRIDVWEFEKWMKVLRRQDAKYAEGLNRIGHKMGWAKIKIPTVKNKDRSKYKPSRTQKFMNAKKEIKSSKRVWLEVIGSRLCKYTSASTPKRTLIPRDSSDRLVVVAAIYDSEDKIQELARLQLSDIEVERVEEEARVAEGWEDDSGPTKGQKPTGLAQATQSLITGSGQQSVVVLWLRLEGGEQYRVAIDLEASHAESKDQLRINAWVETIRAGISFQGRHRSAKILWDSLAKRLKLVVQLQKQYGEVVSTLPVALTARASQRQHNLTQPRHSPSSRNSSLSDRLFVRRAHSTTCTALPRHNSRKRTYLVRSVIRTLSSRAYGICCSW